MQTIVLRHPEYLWAVPAALAVILACRALRRRPFVAFPLLRLLTGRGYRASRLRQAPSFIAAAAVPFVVLALADPLVPYSEGEVQSRGLDIVLVLDLSSSMEEIMGGHLQFGARRVGSSRVPGAPIGETRLETTKKALTDFIGRRPEDRIGLVVFSDNAYVVSPLTFDHRYLLQYVAMIDNQILRGEGMTAIGEGIAMANTLLERQTKSGAADNKVMVVFTDGEHNHGREPFEPLAEADAAGTRIHLVGLDLEDGIKTKPEVQRLIRTVRRYGGRYFDAATAGQLKEASNSIDVLEKGFLVQARYVRNRPVYHYFTVPAILLLCGALLLRAVPHFIDVT